MRTSLRQVVQGATWTLFGAMSSQAIALCTSILLARTLGAQAFGELSIVRSTVLMLASFLGAGLGVAATKHLAEFRTGTPDSAGSVLGVLLAVASVLSVLGGVTLVALSSFLSDSVLKAPQLQQTLDLAVLLLIASVVSGVQNGALLGIAAFRTFAYLMALEAVLFLFLGLAGAHVVGIDGAILGIGLATSIAVFIRQYALSRLLRDQGISIAIRNLRRDLTLLWAVAIPSTLISTFIQSFEWLGRILIVRAPDGFSQVAIFSAAQSLATVTQIVPSQIANASLPVFTQVHTSRAFQVFRTTLVRTTALALMFGILVAGVLTFASKPLMGLYGEVFSQSNDVLVVLALTYSIAVVTMVLSAALLAADHSWLQVWQKLFWGIAMIGAAYPLANNGALGLAYAYAFANIAFTAIQLHSVVRLLRKY